MGDSSDAKATTAEDEELTPQQQQQQNIMTYKAMMAEAQSITQKIGELDAERNEHNLVMNAVKDMDPNRRCFRLIGGVLVERTIKEVLPAVQKNHERITEVIGQLSAQLKQKQVALNDFVTKNNIGVNKAMQQEQEQQQQSSQPGGGSGVLV